MKIRILSIFLAFLLLICSGCSRNTAGSTLDCSEQAENELRESGGHDSVETTKLVNGESWHLAQRTIDLPKNMQTVTAQCVDGERIYIGGYTDTGVVVDELRKIAASIEKRGQCDRQKTGQRDLLFLIDGATPFHKRQSRCL